MKDARVRTAFDADPIRRETRKTARFSALIGRLDRFLFDPSPAGESVWYAIFFAIAVLIVGDIIFAAVRGHGTL